MPSLGYHPNPEFEHIVARAKALALTDKAMEIRDLAQGNASWSGSIPPNIYVEPATPVSAIATVRLKPAGFKGNFFEDGTGARATRRGAYRGRNPKRPFMRPARDQAMQTPLPLYKYL